MNTLLICEDEKLIRAGIRAMVQRSGVPVGQILEANNGEKALEILQSQHVDAVFTDIRMPRMDGIALVRAIQQLPEKPYIVAISGYDDFSYAVEMLRNGVLEYLLKPVEREKIREVLGKIEDRLQQDSAAARVQALEHVVGSSYAVVMLPAAVQEEEAALNGAAVLPDGEDGNFYAVSEGTLQAFLDLASDDGALGISSVHEGHASLGQAAREARHARREAFMLCRNTVYPGTADAAERDAEEPCISENARMRRVQLIGTEKQKELLRVWNDFFDAGEKGLCRPEEFHDELLASLKLIGKVYRSLIDDDIEKTLSELQSPLSWPDLKSYRDDFTDFLLVLNFRREEKDDAEPQQKKMQLAVDYIRENYRKDLNMAVVSNYISMNYSLFSYSFKQYTGENFVTYLKNIRMQEIRRLLVETDDKIIDIAAAAGYGNYKHFLKLFRNEYGVSPTEYRRNMQKNRPAGTK